MRREKKPLTPSRLEAAILQLLATQHHPLSKREIARYLKLKGTAARIELKDILSHLVISGDVRRDRNTYSIAQSQQNLHIGQIVPATIGHVDEDGRLMGVVGEKPIHLLPKSHQRQLNPGVSVLVKLVGHEDEQWVGEVIRFIERPLKNHVGILFHERREAVLEPCDRRSRGGGMRIPRDQVKEYPDGAVLAYSHHRGELKIHDMLGLASDPKVFSLLAIHTHNIPHVFPEQAILEAEQGRIPHLGQRKDLRHLPLVTIDGADARDFDDAVCAQPLDSGGWRLWVAIADVSYYVTPGSVLDHESERRGNSVYFPDRVVPMLPEALSNELCSLKPNVDRACLAVEIHISGVGKIEQFHFYRALMRSRARLTYEEVQKAMDTSEHELFETIIKPLYGAYACLLKERLHRGTLDLNVPERWVVFDDQGQIDAIVPRQRLESHRLIEEFMIAANVAAAKTLSRHQEPGLYRIHDAPDRLRVANLRMVLKKIKIPMGPAAIPSPHQFNQILRKTEGTALERMVHELVLRAQAQARYSPMNIGHYGLNLKHYAHFTSPIRRYADLLVHRALIQCLNLPHDPQESVHQSLNLLKVSQHISETERTAAMAEREAMKRYAAAYLNTFKENEFPAVVTGVIRQGVFAEVGSTGAEGFIPRSALPGSLIFDQANNRYANRRSNVSIQIGQKIRVEIIRIEPTIPLIHLRFLG